MQMNLINLIYNFSLTSKIVSFKTLILAIKLILTIINEPKAWIGLKIDDTKYDSYY